MGCLCCNNEVSVKEIMSRHSESIDQVVGIIVDNKRLEGERREGVGVLAQLTASQHQEIFSVIRSRLDIIFSGITSKLICKIKRYYNEINFAYLLPS